MENHNDDIEDIIYFWINTDNCKEPVRRQLLNFRNINKIFSVITEFSVSKKNYLCLTENDEDILMNYFIMSFALYHNLNPKFFSNYGDILKIKEFIKIFFDLKNPVNDLSNRDIYWIYPKLEYKSFLANCINNNYFEEYYVSPEAMNSLVEIISAFSWSEYMDLDKSPILQENLINLPTLIYANIKLYEKGYLNIREVDNGLEISLNVHGDNCNNNIFSKYKEVLMERIVKTCNENYKTNFTSKDIKV